MIKVTDYIALRLRHRYNIECFFMVSGGGAMHLNDSLGHIIPYVANHHEQACSIAAEGYARACNKLAVVNVTTGPGGLNCLNGVFGEWTDSVPVLYISGQVKYTTMLASCPDIKGLRQLGDQEVDIISVVKPLTKYAETIFEAKMVKYHLDRAIYEATHGRPGPVWLDVPMNVQGALVDENELVDFVPPKNAIPATFPLLEIVEKLSRAKRPLVVAGHGLSIAGQKKNLLSWIEKNNLPVATSLNGIDLIPSDHPLFMGRIGTVGQRNGNFVLQNADVILFLGTRNNIRQVSYNWENFASKAYKIVVDIDEAELKKPLVKPDMAIAADLSDLMPQLCELVVSSPSEEWLNYCRNLRERYAFSSFAEYRQKEGERINPFLFLHTFTRNLRDDELLVTANGTVFVSTHAVAFIKNNTKVIYNSGNASMGYELPAAIGAAMATPGKDVVCLAGDGSIMMNLQELQTIRHYKLPIKIFVVNNAGYSSIRQTQRNFFSGRMTGCGAESGVSVPDFCKVAAAFDLPTVRISEPEHMGEQIQAVLSSPGPILCEVMVEQEYAFIPKLSSRKLPDGTMVSPSLEDMFPFIDREEYKRNMLQ